MRCGRYYLRQGWIFVVAWVLITVAWPTPRAAIPPQVLSDITVLYQNGQWHVLLTGSESITYRALKVAEPLRLVVDLPNTFNEVVPKPLILENQVIGTIKARQLVRDPQPLTRVEIGLTRDTSYKISRVQDKIWVSFDPDQPVSKVESGQGEPVVEPQLEHYPEEHKVFTPKPSVKPALHDSQPRGENSAVSASTVLSIHTLQLERELKYYILADGSLADYYAFHLINPPRLVVDLMGVKSTEIKDTQSSSGPWVKKIRVGLYTNKVRVVFDLVPEAGLPYQIISGGDRLVVSFTEGAGFPPR